MPKVKGLGFSPELKVNLVKLSPFDFAFESKENLLRSFAVDSTVGCCASGLEALPSMLDFNHALLSIRIVTHVITWFLVD